MGESMVESINDSLPKSALKSLQKHGVLNEQAAVVPFSQQIEELKDAKADRDLCEYNHAINRAE